MTDPIPSVYGFFLEKYGSFTDIQKTAIPIIAEGNNCLIVAPTGSGKTEAAVLPILEKIAIRHSEGKTEGIMLLYITPLRALNRDMLKRLDLLCGSLGITISVRHGDTKQSERARQTRKAPNVLITTPETLQSILPTAAFRKAFGSLEAVIIDEVHELYSSKRGAQLSVALERLEFIRKGFLRIGIGATIGDLQLVSNFLSPRRECRIASLERTKRMHIRIEFPDRVGRALGEAEGKFGLDREAVARLGKIIDYITEHKSTLIFANTRQVVEAVGSRLTFMNKELHFGSIGIHHGSLSKEERVEIEDKFKEGYLRGVIATSSLELGIDIGSIDLVIQYGSPKQAARLLQRVGRSGHTEARESNGVIMATSMMDVFESLAVCNNAVAGVLEAGKTHDNALDVLVHQVCGILLDRGALEIEQIFSMLRQSYIYKDLQLDVFNGILQFMQERHLVRLATGQVEPVGKTRMFYYEHVSFIPESKRFVVKDLYTNRIVSNLDERFVTNYLEEGGVFITKGLPWKVISIEEHTIIAEMSSEFEAAVPDWSGGDIPVSHMVSEEVFRILSGKAHQMDEFISKGLSDKVNVFIAEQAKHFAPQADKLVIEDTGEYKVLYSPLGSLGNDALGKLISHFITARFGKSALVRTSPYSILIEFRGKYDISDPIRALSPENITGLLEQAVSDTAIFSYKFAEVATSLGILDKGTTVPRRTILKLAKMMKDTPVYKETIRELLNNYFDTETLVSFVEGLKSRRIQIVQEKVDELSPFENMVLNSAYNAKELVMPLTPNSVVIDSFAEYLLRKNVELLCTYCGMHFKRKLTDLETQDEIRCPNCKSNMLVNYSDDYLKVVEKRISGKRLSRDERVSLGEIMKETGLFTAYGGKAAVALATYGVGPRAAARALMMFRKDRKDFFLDLIEAQRQFIKTKKYWSV